MTFSVADAEEAKETRIGLPKGLVEAEQVAKAENHMVAHTVVGIVELHRTQDAQVGHLDIVEAGQADAHAY